MAASFHEGGREGRLFDKEIELEMVADGAGVDKIDKIQFFSKIRKTVEIVVFQPTTIIRLLARFLA
jgi:hypothetical protein